MRKILFSIASAALVVAACDNAAEADEDFALAETGLFDDADVTQAEAPPRLAQANAQYGGQNRAQNAPPQQMGKIAPGAVRVKRVSIMDPTGFEKPMVATTVLVPADWRTQGGVSWGGTPGCGGGYNIDYRADAPDGVSGVHFFPMEHWTWNNMGMQSSSGCPLMQIFTAEQYIQNLLSRARANARILDFRPRPDIVQQYKALNQVTAMPGGELRQWVESVEALIAYNQNGIDMRETVVVAVMFSKSTMQGLGTTAETIMAGSLPGFAMRAPNGKLDFKLAEFIRNSGKTNPEWSARIAKHHQKMAGISAKGARDRSRMIAKTGDEIREIQTEMWRNSNESFDRMSRENSEVVRGVETYNDPYYGGTVQLDSTYERAWQANDGSYILSNDHLFEPYRDLGVDAQQLEVAQ